MSELLSNKHYWGIHRLKELVMQHQKVEKLWLLGERGDNHMGQLGPQLVSEPLHRVIV
jgi:hypothetical protein